MKKKSCFCQYWHWVIWHILIKTSTTFKHNFLHFENLWEIPINIPCCYLHIVATCEPFFLSLTTLFFPGHQHKTKVRFCRHEKESVTLVRNRLWPSSPEAPRVAFDFRLLELALSLQLEGQLSLQSFCGAILQSKIGFPVFMQTDEVWIPWKIHV